MLYLHYIYVFSGTKPSPTDAGQIPEHVRPDHQ